MDATYAHHCPKCGEAKPQAAGSPFDLNKLLERAIKAVHKGKADEVLAVLGKGFAARIGDGVNEGFGKKTFDVAFDSPDSEMIRHLQTNAYEFSFAKSYQQLQALTQSLYDQGGHVIPFHEFKEIATRINNELAVRHLETEYNTAIASGQMASRWVQFEADKGQFPNLTYQTVGDERVRATHAALDGVTRPIEDPFWSRYYPPNGWGCRCDVIQAVGRRVTPADKIAEPDDVPALFKTNTAKTGLVFPVGHPYYEHLPTDVTKAANNSNPYTYEKIHTGKKGGYVYRSALSNTDDHEIKAFKVLADKGERIILLPEIPPNTEAQLSLKKLSQPGGIKESKNVDAISHTRLIEMKHPKATKSAIDRAIRDANSKVDNLARITLCLKFDVKVPAKLLRDVLKSRLPRAKEINEVWIIDNKDQLKKMLRAGILKTKVSKP